MKWIIFAAALLVPLACQAAGDAAAGRRVYETRCLGCHGDDRTAGTIGPDLKGLFGRKAATQKSGVHSRALMEADIRWDEASLRKFLSAPSKAVPGTTMPVDVPTSSQLDNLIAYLRSLR